MCCKENKCFAAFVLVGIYAPTRILLYIEGYSFGKTTKEGGFMVIKIDFQSEEALYMQLRNQIILGIATSVIQEGDSLAVRPAAGGRYRHQHAHGQQGIFSVASGRISDNRPEKGSRDCTGC